MVRRALLVVGLTLGLLGMHGLASGQPVAHARQASIPPATMDSGAAAKAVGQGTSAPCHRDPAPHHNLSKAVRTGSASSINLTTTPALRDAGEAIAPAPPTRALAGSGDPRPPDISRLGVLRI